MISSLLSSVTKARQISRGKTARNGTWIIAERIVSVGLTTIVTIMSARYLGTANYGILSYGASFVTLFLGLMKLGLDSILVNELIKNKFHQGQILGTSLALRLMSSVISTTIIFLLVSLLNPDNGLMISVAMVQALMLIFQAFNVFDYWFQSKLKSKYVSMAKVLASITVFGYSLYLLLSEKSLIWFAFSLSISSLIIAVLLLYFYKKSTVQKLSFSKETAKYLLSKSYHFIIASVIVSVYVQIDKVMIIGFLSAEQLGLYSVALTVCTAWMFLPDAITTSIRPSIYSAKLRSETDYIRRLKQLYFIIFWISFVIVAIISAISPWVINTLFGEQYQQSAQVLRIMIWFVPFSVLGSARGIWIVGEDKGKFTKYYLIIGVILTVILNMLLLPIMGILGAAIATVATEFITCFIAPLLYSATRQHTKITVQALFYKL